MLVKLHEEDIKKVDTEEEEGLPPPDVVVHKEEDEGDQGDAVEGAVPEQRPPREVQHCFAEQGAHSDHEQDVEHGRTHDGADAHVGECDEHSDDRGKEFWRGAPGGHEGGAGHVLADAELFDDDIERGNEELVTDDGEGHEHVDDAEDVENHGAALQLLLVEEIWRKEGIWLWLCVCLVAIRRGLKKMSEQDSRRISIGFKLPQPLFALFTRVGLSFGLAATVDILLHP